MTKYDSKTALVIVDVQERLRRSERLALRLGRGGRRSAHKRRGAERAGAAGAVVVYTQDWHPETTQHFQKDGGIWPVHCVAQTWGAEFHPELNVDGPTIRKGSGGEDGYSAFSVRDPESGEQHSTELNNLLRERGIERVVVVGLATDYCVKETALDAARLRFDTTIRKDAMRADDLQPGDGDRAVQEMVAAGARVE